MTRNYTSPSCEEIMLKMEETVMSADSNSHYTEYPCIGCSDRYTYRCNKCLYGDHKTKFV